MHWLMLVHIHKCILSAYQPCTYLVLTNIMVEGCCLATGPVGPLLCTPISFQTLDQTIFLIFYICTQHMHIQLLLLLLVVRKYVHMCNLQWDLTFKTTLQIGPLLTLRPLLLSPIKNVPLYFYSKLGPPQITRPVQDSLLGCLNSEVPL